MLKNTLKKLSGSTQTTGNRSTSSRSGKKGTKGKKKNKSKKKKEKELDLENESNFEDEEFEESEDFGEDEEFEEDDFGDELGDALDDELEDDEESSGKITEIEARVKDAENEVGQISSKLNTVRAENEEIGNKISEMEENIRKLLGIYEMVTEGINPFATETGFGGEGLGIFSTGKESKQEDVPEEILSEDAESFFDDVDDDNEEMESEPEMESDENLSMGGGESIESKSEGSPEDLFKKLKEENEEEQGNEMEEEQESKEINFEEPELVDDWSERPPKSFSSPYLKDIPRDLISDVIALKWMDYLVNTFGIKRMADILDFYVDIGWISKNVKDLLINYSRGYVLREGQLIDEPEAPTLRDHFKSLIFISKLGGHDLNIEEVERLVKEVEELEKDVNDVITEHALGSNC